MQFRTQILFKNQSNNLIDYSSRLLFLGSCFSENIFLKVNNNKFIAYSNPFGVLFHPIAIENLLFMVAKRKIIKEKDVFKYNDTWHYFNANSSISNSSKKQLLNNLNKAVLSTNNVLCNATHIVITFGTAWVYRYLPENKVVANCHKVPQKEFSKELLSVQEITTSIQKSIKHIRELNTKATILLTLSPVRHLKDGFVENSQSKAHLLTAIHKVINTEKEVFYFPSFEIMNDDLREYRFYKEDLIHPNQMAIEYIWCCFKELWINSKVFPIMKEVEQVHKALQHKPNNSNTKQHKAFLKKLNEKIENLKTKGIYF